MNPLVAKVVSRWASQKSAILKQKHREETDQEEWALFDSKGEQVLKWFGPKKPSDEAVAKEEARIQYFKNQASRVAARYKDKKKLESGNVLYQYSEQQIARRNNEKAKRLEALRKNVGSLRAQVKKDLKSGDPEKVLTALAVGLMDHTAERVGNPTSAEEGHVGVTGWNKSHVSFSKGKATVSYVGKSGVKQKKTVTDKMLVSALRDAYEACEDDIFCHASGTVDAKKVNAYLKKFDITAKDLRGLHANQTMQEKLKAIRKGELPTDPKERKEQLKKEFKKALEETAADVGHEPSTLRSQYLVPDLEEEFMKGRVMDKMVKTASNVAQRFIQARAIRMDKRAIAELATEMAKIVYRKTDGRTPLGKNVLNSRPYPYVVKAVDDSLINTNIILKSEETMAPSYVVDGGMGTYRGEPIVIITINGSTVIPKNTAGVLERQLFPVLLHELTHVADKYKGRGVAPDMSRDEAQGNAAYYNDPGEVRAYMQEVVDEIEAKSKHFSVFMDRFGPSKGLEYLLKSSNTWDEISPYWTEANKRLVIKAVVQMINGYMSEK